MTSDGRWITPWRRSVRVRITLAAAAVTLLSALVGSVLFVSVLHESLVLSLLNSAQQQAEAVVAQLNNGQSEKQVVVTGKNDVFVQIVDAHGVVLASDHPSVTLPIRTSAGSSKGIVVPTLLDTFAVYAQPVGNGQLAVVGLSDEQAEQATSTSITILTVAVPAAVILLSLVVWLSVGRALQPVEVMRREAAAISTERLDQRLAVPPGRDEIPRLALTLNAMLTRIADSQQQQRQFIADASHELRSPLAIIRQRADTALRHPDSTTVKQLADEVLHTEHRMEDLVNALLTLARLDENAAKKDCPVDLDDLCLQEIDKLKLIKPNIEFDRSSLSAGQVLGDPMLLTQILTNLLTNAARHATATVRVALAETEDSIVLTVEDDGHGIEVTERERVFERFARLDEARAREAGGAGLGLAIVVAATTSIGGRVSLDDSPLGGARFVVTLPSAATAWRDIGDWTRA